MGLLSHTTKYFLTHWETLTVAFDYNHRTERKLYSTKWTFIESIFTAPVIYIKYPVRQAQINSPPKLEVLLTQVTLLMDKSVFFTSYSGNLTDLVRFKIMINTYLHIIFTHFQVLESTENHHLTQLVAILFLMSSQRQLKHTVYWQNVNCSLCHYILASPQRDDKEGHK